MLIALLKICIQLYSHQQYNIYYMYSLTHFYQVLCGARIQLYMSVAIQSSTFPLVLCRDIYFIWYFLIPFLQPQHHTTLYGSPQQCEHTTNKIKLSRTSINGAMLKSPYIHLRRIIITFLHRAPHTTMVKTNRYYYIEISLLYK